MQELMIRPVIYRFDTFGEFAAQMKPGKGDLILTNRFLYEPFLAEFCEECQVLFQEEYGAGEPTDLMVEAICRDMKSSPRRILAVGGGTVIDIAKILALDCPVPVENLYDGTTPLRRSRELVLIPTTCGTGSEVTNISILALTRQNTKKGLVGDCMYADSAVLIPELVKGLPFRFFATSSIDALIHAMESSLSPKSNDTLRMFSYKAIDMILKGYQRIAKEGPEARTEMLGEFLMASTYAGIAFGNAGCGAVHALSYPLGAVHHVPHGESNYAMLTGVMKKYMSIRSDGQIACLNRYMASILGCEEGQVYEALEQLLNQLLPRKPLHEYGMTEEELETFTDSVVTQQTRLLANNFVPLSREQILEIYESLY